jgi:hypothetical protein
MVLQNSEKLLVQAINELVQDFGGPTKVVWKVLAQKLALHPTIAHLGPPDVIRWLQYCAKGTHLKTLYLQQIVWDPKWNHFIDIKGIDNMKDQDWLQCYPNEPLAIHTPFILRSEYERQNLINQKVRSHKLTIMENLPFPVLPAVKQTNELLHAQYIGGLKPEEPDLALSMSDVEFSGNSCEGIN